MLFGRKQARKRDMAIGLDLGSQQWKAVLIQRAEQGLKLRHHVVIPCAASPAKPGSETAFVEALQALLAPLKTSDRHAFVAISSPASFVAEFEMPRTQPQDLRGAISLNGVRLLRRDLSGCYFDAVELGDPSADGKARRTATMQTMVAAAPKEEVIWYRNVLDNAKIKAETIELSAVAVVNALQCSHAAICEQHVVLLLDIGHQLTSLNFLRHGQPLLTRLMPFGGAQLTDLLTRSLGVPVAEAEKQKRSLNEESVAIMQGALQSLAREVRASVDFIESQQDCQIRHAFAGGGTACNPVILEALSQEVGLPITQWSPLEGLQTDPSEAADLAAIAPSLGAAIGVAAAKL
jgi:type IV pilus assembly protein PilM